MPRLMAVLYDRLLAGAEDACLGEWRAELVGSLRGEVLEVGAGTGANLDHYPAEVTRVILSEPDRHMRARLQRKLPAGDGRFEVINAAVEELPLPEASLEAVVATLVLCSVGDVDRALSEIHRVLRPGGRFAFIEHVAAEEGTARLKWQRRVEPVWRRLAGNCHLARRTGDTIRAAGFDVEWMKDEEIGNALPLVRPGIRGIAVKSE
ncbi:MAG: methyltransferase domain-containing protein [Gemmatimonadota bacterium]